MGGTELRQDVCQCLSGFAVIVGALGMAVSFLFLASASLADITAGTSGFVAGSILAGSGLVSLAVGTRARAT